MASELPIHIILHHIAPRLSAKSVLRLMTVSKEFHSFLSTQSFAKIHLHHQIHPKLLLLSTTKPYNFTTIDCETSPLADDDDGLTPLSHRVPFEADYPGYIQILASFHGLVCVGIRDRRQLHNFELIIWNPVTGDYKNLPKTTFLDQPYNTTFELYYSSCDDDYKLLHVTRIGEVYNYSLKSDSWRKLVDDSTNKLRRKRALYSARLNENLYFLNDRSPFSLMRFDTTSEDITDITSSLPRRFGSSVLNASLIVHKDCVYLIVRYDGIQGRIYVEYESWRMIRDREWSKVDTHKILEVLAHRLSLKKKYTQLRIFGGEDIPIYTETLVSPNHYSVA